MSRHNRAPLPPGEEERLETLNEKILAFLKLGPQYNSELSKIALDYGRRIRDLRADGWTILRKRVEGGLNLYTLLPDREPEWTVDVRITLADGTESIQHIKVRGSSEGLVRNRAQHLAHRVKVLASLRVPEA